MAGMPQGRSHVPLHVGHRGVEHVLGALLRVPDITAPARTNTREQTQTTHKYGPNKCTKFQVHTPPTPPPTPGIVDHPSFL